jgi:nucleolar protein 56
MDRIINAISSRLREWYGLHFPELDNIIDSINGYSQIVLAGKRDKLSKKTFEDAGFPESKVEMLTLVTEKSRGGDITDANLAIVQTLAKQILELFDLRKNLEDHVETEMRKIAPNLSAVLGTSVGARILARAGSIKNLAIMPASTIQVLGAEKALFRSLKTGSQPPKHGLLFQHTLVHAAPRWQRGKIARAIAGKAAIASRVDYHGGGLNQVLLDKLNIRVDEIGKKYVEPPERKEPRPEPQRQRERGGERYRRDEPRYRDRQRGRTRPSERDRPSFKKSKDKKRKKFGRR